jgi:GNAT superfamily N-acetyltransferase
VRAATLADAETLARIHVRSWQAAYGQLFPVEALEPLTDTRERRAERWRETAMSATPRTHALVAERDGEVVGFATVGPAEDEDRTSVGELTMLYIAPEAWGRGAGRALMAEALSRLRSDGFAEAILWVFEDNPRTRRFYELAGWAADGGFKGQQWLGTLVRAVRYRIALDPSA